ncbi:MAG: DUF1016 family protein [Treponema sp.]|nr:DUF1016 family protein [Treponema sp.]
MTNELAPTTNNSKFYKEISSILHTARANAYKAINFAMVTSYWSVGQVIVEDEQSGNERAEYGKAVLEGLSKRLTAKFGKGFDESNLRYMRLFYQTFKNCDALRHELSWSHYRILLRVKDETARNWYMNEAANQTWSTRQLDRQISVLYYERLLVSQDKKSVQIEAKTKLSEIEPQQFIHDPYVLEFLNLKNYPALHESTNEQDLIDLKLGKLTHGDVGQMDSYIRMFDAQYKRDDDNPTIGLILCSEKNEAVVKYSVLADAKQIFASKYELALPKPEELAKQIKMDRLLIEEQMKNSEEDTE